VFYFIAASVLIFSIYAGKPWLFLISLIPFIFLAWRIFLSRDPDLPSTENTMRSEFEKLRKNGERMFVDFDNCEFKDSSYTDEIIDERMMRFNTLNLDYGKVISRDFVGQSLLIYHHQIGDKSEKFVQPFPCTADALKVYVLQKSVDLYVDPFDRSHYYFDLKGV